MISRNPAKINTLKSSIRDSNSFCPTKLQDFRETENAWKVQESQLIWTIFFIFLSYFIKKGHFTMFYLKKMSKRWQSLMIDLIKLVSKWLMPFFKITTRFSFCKNAQFKFSLLDRNNKFLQGDNSWENFEKEKLWHKKI